MLNGNPSVRDSGLPFLQSSKHIEGMDISRLKLQLFEGSSPSVKTKPTERTNPCKQYSFQSGNYGLLIPLPSSVT